MHYFIFFTIKLKYMAGQQSFQACKHPEEDLLQFKLSIRTKGDLSDFEASWLLIPHELAWLMTETANLLQFSAELSLELLAAVQKTSKVSIQC